MSLLETIDRKLQTSIPFDASAVTNLVRENIIFFTDRDYDIFIKQLDSYTAYESASLTGMEYNITTHLSVGLVMLGRYSVQLCIPPIKM